MKIRTYTVRATANESARWWYWARQAGFNVLGCWLAMLANQEVKRQEIACGAREPSQAPPSRPPVR